MSGSEFTQAGHGNAFLSTYSNGNVIIAGNNNGASSRIFRSTDHGATWSLTTQVFPGVIYALGGYGSSTTMYAGCNGGTFWRSTDSGLNWTQMTTPPNMIAIYTISVNSIGTIYVGGEVASTSNYCVQYSTNTGSTWNNLINGCTYCMNSMITDKYNYFLIWTTSGTNLSLFYGTGTSSYSFKTVSTSASISGFLGLQKDSKGNIVVPVSYSSPASVFVFTINENRINSSNFVLTNIIPLTMIAYNFNQLVCVDDTFVLLVNSNVTNNGCYIYLSQNGGVNWVLKKMPNDVTSDTTNRAFLSMCYHNNSTLANKYLIFAGGAVSGASFTGSLRINRSSLAYFLTEHKLGLNLGVWASAPLSKLTVSLPTAGSTYNYLFAAVMKREYTYNGKTYIDRSEPYYFSYSTTNAISTTNPLKIDNIQQVLSASVNEQYTGVTNSTYSDMYVIELYRTKTNETTYYKIGELNAPYTTTPYSYYSFLPDQDMALAGQITLYTSSNNVGYVPPPRCRFVVNNGEVTYYGACFGSTTNNKDYLTNYDNRIYLSHKNNDSTYHTFFIDMPATVDDLCVVYGKVYASCGLKWYRLDGVFESNGTGGCTYVLVSGNFGAINNSLGVNGVYGRYFLATDGIYLFGGGIPVKVSTFNDIYLNLQIKDSAYLKDKKLIIFSCRDLGDNYTKHIPKGNNFLLVYSELSKTWTIWHNHNSFDDFYNDKFTVNGNFAYNFTHTDDVEDVNACFFEYINEQELDNVASLWLYAPGLVPSVFLFPKKLCRLNDAYYRPVDTIAICYDRSNNPIVVDIDYLQRPIPINILTPNLTPSINKKISTTAYITAELTHVHSNYNIGAGSFMPYVMKDEDNIYRKMPSYNFIRSRQMLKNESYPYYGKENIIDLNLQRMLPDSVSRNKSISLGVRNHYDLQYTNIPNQTLTTDENAAVKFYEFTIESYYGTTFVLTAKQGEIFYGSTPVNFGDYICVYYLQDGKYLPIGITLFGGKTNTMTPSVICGLNSFIGTDTIEITVPSVFSISQNLAPGETWYAIICKKSFMDNYNFTNLAIGYVDYGVNNDAGKEEK
jgi:hypothetical protein